METEILQEIRESLKKIETLATPVVIAHASEVELDQIREALRNDGGSRFVDLKTVEPVFGSHEIVGYDPAKREVVDVMNDINKLAVANTDVLHVFTRFSAHVNEFHVGVNQNVNKDYIQERADYSFCEGVYLDQDEPLEKLVAIEKELIELIAKAHSEKREVLA